MTKGREASQARHSLRGVSLFKLGSYYDETSKYFTFGSRSSQQFSIPAT